MKTIMVIDDETSILENIKQSLEKNEYNVITAQTSKKALELISDEKEQDFGLILIDTVIPGSDTPALFSMKPQSKKNIDTTKEEDFLKKPFTKQELLEFVNNKV